MYQILPYNRIMWYSKNSLEILYVPNYSDNIIQSTELPVDQHCAFASTNGKMIVTQWMKSNAGLINLLPSMS